MGKNLTNFVEKIKNRNLQKFLRPAGAKIIFPEVDDISFFSQIPEIFCFFSKKYLHEMLRISIFIFFDFF